MEKIVTVVYDGDCPICHRFITVTQLKDSGIELVLINARNEDVYAIDWFPSYVNINSDMVVKINNTLFHGGQAMHALSLLASASTFLNKMTYALFSIKPIAYVLYPVLRAGRKIILKFYGIKPLENNRP